MAGAGCARSGPVVEAATIPTEVALAEAKVDGGRPPPPSKTSSDVPWKRGQRLKGFYYCAQGKTNITLEIRDISGDDFDAVAEFAFPGGSRHPPARGAWRIRGSFEPSKRTVRLEADAWIDQPEGYVLADFSGKVEPDGSIKGTVEGDGCSTFVLNPDKTGARL